MSPGALKMTIQLFFHNLLQFISVDLVAPIHYLHYNVYTDVAQHLFDNNYQVVGVGGVCEGVGWGGWRQPIISLHILKSHCFLTNSRLHRP